jgi:hypothetical protein
MNPQKNCQVMGSGDSTDSAQIWQAPRRRLRGWRIKNPVEIVSQARKSEKFPRPPNKDAGIFRIQLIVSFRFLTIRP